MSKRRGLTAWLTGHPWVPYVAGAGGGGWTLSYLIASDIYRADDGRKTAPDWVFLSWTLGGALLAALAAYWFARSQHMFDETERPQPRETVNPALRQLLDGYPNAAAFVLNPATDFLASNGLADALFSPFGNMDNMARMTFLDQAARGFFTQWGRAAEAVVAGLRHATGLDPHYPRLHGLVRSLAEASKEFAALWSSHIVHGKTHDAKELLHPDVGPLALTFQTFDVRGAPGQQLMIYHAEPGSRGAQALSLLGSLHATQHQQPAPEA